MVVYTYTYIYIYASSDFLIIRHRREIAYICVEKVEPSNFCILTNTFALVLDIAGPSVALNTIKRSLNHKC